MNVAELNEELTKFFQEVPSDDLSGLEDDIFKVFNSLVNITDNDLEQIRQDYISIINNIPMSYIKEVLTKNKITVSELVDYFNNELNDEAKIKFLDSFVIDVPGYYISEKFSDILNIYAYSILIAEPLNADANDGLMDVFCESEGLKI